MTGPIDWGQATALLAVVGSIVAIVTAVLSARRTGRKEVVQEASATQEMRGDLKYLVRGMDDVRVEQRRQGDELRGVGDRLTRVEESSKSAHKRIDGIEGRKPE